MTDCFEKPDLGTSLTTFQVGQLLHDREHTQQALILDGGTPSLRSNRPLAERRALALVFDTRTGERILSNNSEVVIDIYHNIPTSKRWHVAETYVLGMDIIDQPVPTVPTCLWASDDLLETGRNCPCGCGNQAQDCSCNYCDGSCDTGVQIVGLTCDSCQNHGSCGCSCGCDTTIADSDGLCWDCDNTNICSDCNETHDLYRNDLCAYCYEMEAERVRAEEASKTKTSKPEDA